MIIDCLCRICGNKMSYDTYYNESRYTQEEWDSQYHDVCSWRCRLQLFYDSTIIPMEE